MSNGEQTEETRKYEEYLAKHGKDQRPGQALMNAFYTAWGEWPDHLPDVWEVTDVHHIDLAKWQLEAYKRSQEE